MFDLSLEELQLDLDEFEKVEQIGKFSRLKVGLAFGGGFLM